MNRDAPDAWTAGSVRSCLAVHPASEAGPITRIEVELSRRGNLLRLRYDAWGAVEAVEIPPPAAIPNRKDGLWRHSCFEMFGRAGGERYIEFNLAPSGDWAGYAFDRYRQGQAPLEAEPPSIAFERHQDRLRLEAIVRLPRSNLRRLALSAVIEDREGRLSYWALAHPSDKPDFHHPDSFVLDLP